MSIQQLREMSVTDLEAEILILRKQQFQMRIKRMTDSVVKPHELRALRKNIARVKTLLTEKAGS